jgi:hypothetical protein
VPLLVVAELAPQALTASATAYASTLIRLTRTS